MPRQHRIRKKKSIFFYCMLDNAMIQCKSKEIIIIMEDLNANVGKERNGKITGKFGLGTRNDRKEKWVHFCTANENIMANKWFQGHPRRLYTSGNIGGESKI